MARVRCPVQEQWNGRALCSICNHLHNLRVEHVIFKLAALLSVLAARLRVVQRVCWMTERVGGGSVLLPHVYHGDYLLGIAGDVAGPHAAFVKLSPVIVAVPEIAKPRGESTPDRCVLEGRHAGIPLRCDSIALVSQSAYSARQHFEVLACRGA